MMAELDVTTDVSVDSRPVAMEVVRHRRRSRIGTEQRCYLLSRPLVVGEEIPRSIVMIPSSTAVHIYPAGSDGDVADYRQHAIVDGITDHDLALALLGYRSYASTVPASVRP